MKKLGHKVDQKRVFFSEIQDDNPLDCLIEKLNIAKISLNVCFFLVISLVPSSHIFLFIELYIYFIGGFGGKEENDSVF